MDIELGDGISFELFNQYKLTCPIIFTTAYDEYAIQAFRVNGVDYLLKPIVEEELKNAIERCRSIIENKNKYFVDMPQLVKTLAHPNHKRPPYKEKFIVSVRNQWMPININDIACLTSSA